MLAKLISVPFYLLILNYENVSNAGYIYFFFVVSVREIFSPLKRKQILVTFFFLFFFLKKNIFAVCAVFFRALCSKTSSYVEKGEI